MAGPGAAQGPTRGRTLAGAVLVWDDAFLGYDFGAGHPFTERSRALAVALLDAWRGDAADPLPLDRVDRVVPASEERLLRFHSADYLDRVREYGADARRRPLDRGDTPSFPGCYEAAARLVGGTLTALEIARGTAGRSAFMPAGGLHHAGPERASGFCILNDVAVAIAEAFATGVSRAAYVDVDVHHGDGVMYGFYADGRLLDIDFHESGRTLFPGTGDPLETGAGDGEGLKVNVALPPGAGDASFRRLFDRVVPALLREHRPELIVMQCGTDGHAGDALGHLEYTTVSYAHAAGRLDAIARELGCGLLVTGGGGYDASNVARSLALVGALLAGDTDAATVRDRLPERWRAEFRRVAHAPPPEALCDAAGAASESAPPAWENDLVRTLERALGRKLSPA